MRRRGDRSEGEMNKTRKHRKPNHKKHGAGQERAAATRWNESASRGAGEKEREGTLVCIQAVAAMLMFITLLTYYHRRIGIKTKMRDVD